MDFYLGYRFLSFAKNMSRNIAKNKSQNLSSKYNQKRIAYTKQTATDVIKTV